MVLVHPESAQRRCTDYACLAVRVVVMTALVGYTAWFLFGFPTATTDVSETLVIVGYDLAILTLVSSQWKRCLVSRIALSLAVNFLLASLLVISEVGVALVPIPFLLIVWSAMESWFVDEPDATDETWEEGNIWSLRGDSNS